jgi:4-amino-4-deoxy-L-arabinose transferase-like glycosyltransferase
MPPFQVPDEPAHFAYVQQLAETGSLPTVSSTHYAPEEGITLRDLDHNEVRYNALQGTISTPAQQQRLEHDLAQSIPRHGEGAAGVATTQPPLYYALQTIPYRLASSGNLLERLALMKLLSALMAGLTALFAFLFLREALPGAPWAWTVGALGVALFPLLSFMSGAVNPDSMLSAVSAALFYCLARAFRRGLSPRLAVAIGVVTAVGFLTKLNFLGLVPGLALALIVLTRRAARSEGRAAYRSLATAAAIGASPVCLYALVNLLSNHPGLGLASVGIDLTRKHGSLLGEVSYIWQLYMPRLPGMANDFPGLLTTRLWFDRSVGLYGWLDTTFPSWVYNVALIPAGLIVALFVRALIASRAALRQRIWELLAYAVMGTGVLALVGADSFLEFPERSGGYSEPRYLLPMAVLFGAMLALAARGAGRRWGPVVGALIVVLILGHDIFSQLLVVSRYYG